MKGVKHHKEEQTTIQISEQVANKIRELILEEIDDFRNDYKGWYNNISEYVSDSSKNDMQLPLFKQAAKVVLHNKIQPTRRSDVAGVCVLFYTEAELLLQYYRSLSKPDQQFMYMLTWNKYITYEAAKAHFKKDLIKPITYNYSEAEINPLFRKWGPFLHEDYDDFDDDYDYDDDDEDEDDLEGMIHERNIIFVLPEFMRRAFAQITASPDNYILNPVQIPEDYQVFLSESAIFEELPTILLLLRQGKIKYNQNGYLSVPSLKAAHNNLGLHTFPNDMGYVKALLIASHLWSKEGYDPTTKVTKILQYIFEVQQPNIFTLNAALLPLENLKSLYQSRLNPNELTKALALIKHLPSGQWIKLDQILDYVAVHDLDIDLKPVDSYATYDLRLSRDSVYYDEFEKASQLQRLKIINDFFVTGTLLTAASFGLLDLAYNPKDPKLFPGENMRSHDGRFTACRVTPLGEHLFQGKKDYTPPDTAKPIRFEMDRGSLMIKVDGNMDIAWGLLRAWTKKSISKANELQFDKERILSDCKSKDDLVVSVLSFCDTIHVELPDYWKAKLMELVNQTHAVQPLVQARVYKLSPYDIALHKLVSQDPVLRKLSLKAADFTIIVSHPNEEAFMKRLAQLGYVPYNSDHRNLDEISFIANGEPEEDLIKGFDALANKSNGKEKHTIPKATKAKSKPAKTKATQEFKIFNKRRYL